MIDVFVPFVFVLLVGGGFLAAVQSRTPRAAIGVGSVYAAVLLIYASYPLLVYIALGGFYTPFNDQRLFSDQPPPADIGYIAWLYGAYLASFAAGYLLSSRRAPTNRVLSIVDLDRPATWSLFIVFFTFRLTMLLAEFTLAQDTGDYVESYLKYKHLPLLVQQLLGHLDGMTAVLGLTVMATLCRRWTKYRLLVGAWLALELGLLIVGMGARTQFVLLCLAALFSYHFLYKPITMGRLAATGMALVIAFLGLGILRTFGGAGVTAVGIEAIASASEFEALFANAYEVDRLVARGDIDRSTLAGAVYIGDIVNLVPQQLVPFEKLNLANWYVSTFHTEYAERGGGFAFGVVPQSLIGAGWLDLIVRGLLVGFVFARFDRMVQVERVRLWKFAAYLWLITNCYITFRSTTLALVPVFVYRFVPALLTVIIVAYLLRMAASVPKEVATAGTPLGSRRPAYDRRADL